MTIKDMALLTLANIIGFYGLRMYNDIRQVRLVNALSENSVEVESIGPVIKRTSYVVFKGNDVVKIGYHYKRVGWGPLWRGTGVIVSNKGLILTAGHLARNAHLMQISLAGFNSDKMNKKHPRPLYAYIVGIDEAHDVALLKVINYPGYLRPVLLRNSVQKGLPVLTIGFPTLFEKIVTTGVISAFYDGYTYSDVVIEHGSSGGGLFDANGQLVGLCSMMYLPEGIEVFQGISIWTDLKAIHHLLDKYEGF